MARSMGVGWCGSQNHHTPKNMMPMSSTATATAAASFRNFSAIYPRLRMDDVTGPL
jgi:hypothetical protein